MTNSLLIAHAREIYREVFCSNLDEKIAFLRTLSESEFWEQIEGGMTLYSSWRTKYGTVAEEATEKFQAWLESSSISSPFTHIDEKGKIYEPFPVNIEKDIYDWSWFANYIHPVTLENVSRGPFSKTDKLDSSLLNMNRPENVIFFEDDNGNMQGRVFAVPVDY